jgi:SagB-type dehydrogenase family enzyme
LKAYSSNERDEYEMTDGIGDTFQNETKYRCGKVLGGMLDWSNKPSIYKEYTRNRKIEIPCPKSMGRMSVDGALRKRRSVRSFSSKSISKEQLSYLLWASTGIQRKERGYEFRTVPSAGALYPIETYLTANRVENLAEGVYHYSVKQHLLEELKLGDFGKEVTRAALGQKMCSEAAIVFIWTAIFYRSKWKYKQRAYRYIYLDSGHIAQNLALAATSIELGSCQIGALYDDEVNQILNVDGVKESAIYMSTVGYPR